MRTIIATISLAVLAGCGTWVNATRPDASYYSDHQACMREVGILVIGAKTYGDRLNECLASKGWTSK